MWFVICKLRCSDTDPDGFNNGHAVMGPAALILTDTDESVTVNLPEIILHYEQYTLDMLSHSLYELYTQCPTMCM